jgi:hypothetical protein
MATITMLVMEAKNPIAAVTHRDPYRYYARLLAGPPLQYDNELGLWIACHAATVFEIFTNTACRVRPTTEPVPTKISGSPAGEIFRSLVRMNDGARHDQPKLALPKRCPSAYGEDPVTADTAAASIGYAHAAINSGSRSRRIDELVRQLLENACNEKAFDSKKLERLFGQRLITLHPRQT